jgi:hypothetical protein
MSAVARSLALAALCIGVAHGATEVVLRKALRTSGVVHLPSGVTEIAREIELPANSHDLTIDGGGATLKLADRFFGRALFVCTHCRNIHFENFEVDGNRKMLGRPVGLAPSDRTFARFTPANGILAEESDGVQIHNIQLREIAGFAVLVNHSSHIEIDSVTVDQSGTSNVNKRNNATGGILLEEGTTDFRVTHCALTGILGNGIWTHSMYRSPRNVRGTFSGNKIVRVGRDAIQVGHASEVVVEKNSGAEIGYPVEAVDVEGQATPVAVDTAGDVDKSFYRDNHFLEVNGKCIDLDGFHDGDVTGNECTNQEPRSAYPQGNFGIVLNNSNPDMRSQNVRILNNTIDGWLYGGIVVIGTGHTIEGNHLLRLNMAHCNEEAQQFGCFYLGGEPDVLRSGIYLRKGNHRPDPATGNTIQNNEITGFGMSRHCIASGPGVDETKNRIAHNECSDDGPLSARVY